MRTREKAQKAELCLNRPSSICPIEGKCHPRRCDGTNAGSELKPTLSIPPSDKKAALYKRTLANVGKLRAACYLADRPNSGRCRLKPLIDLHISTIREFHTGQLQSHTLCVRSAAQCNQQMSALERDLHS